MAIRVTLAVNIDDEVDFSYELSQDDDGIIREDEMEPGEYSCVADLAFIQGLEEKTALILCNAIDFAEEYVRVEDSAVEDYPLDFLFRSNPV